MKQWLIKRGARLVTAPPLADPTAVVFTARQEDAANPNITTREAQPPPQIASLKAASRKVKKIQQQLPSKRKRPAANTQEHHAGATETSQTNSTPTAGGTETNQSESTANSSAPAVNATIEIDAQGDTVEDPIIIDEATSNSDHDSEEEADNSA